MSNLVENPEDGFSHNEAQLLYAHTKGVDNTETDIKHSANIPMQYTAIFHGCKNVNFQMKFFNIFLIFAQNIDCGYTLEPPH